MIKLNDVCKETMKSQAFEKGDLGCHIVFHLRVSLPIHGVLRESLSRSGQILSEQPVCDCSVNHRHSHCSRRVVWSECVAQIFPGITDSIQLDRDLGELKHSRVSFDE